MKENKYTFNKIKYKHEKKLKPGEDMKYLTGTEEDIDTIAKKYETIHKIKPAYGCKPRFEHWGKLQQILYNKKIEINSVLDIGTGAGTFTKWAHQNISKHVYASDIANSIKQEYIDLGVNFIKAPSHEIPLPDKSIDLITSFDFLEHVHPDYLEKTILETKRICRGYIFHKIAQHPSGILNLIEDEKIQKQHNLPENIHGQLHLIQEHRTFWEEQVFLPEFPETKFVGGGCYFIEI